jgi:hypothetical protein
MNTEGGSNAGKVLGILLAAVVMLGLAGGAIVLITAGGDDGGGDDSEASADEADGPASTTTEAVDASPSSTRPPTTTTAPLPLDLLRNDPSPAVDAWYDAVGREAQTIRVVLYPTYAFLDVRDPDRPGTLVEYVWRDGVLDGPTPEPVFPGTDLDAESYRLSQVNWDAVPGLVAAAPERAGLPQGEVTHVIVESDLPFSSRFVMRIYVTAPNGSDYVVATVDGQPAER